MSLKQSCFKAVLKSDFKRMWWVGICATAFMFMTFTSAFVQYYSDYYSSDYVVSEFASLVIIGIPIAFVLGQLVFNYLNNGASVTFVHSLPVKRFTLMASHVTFAVITILAPALINYIICLSSVEHGLNPLDVLKAFGIYTVLTLVIFSISMLVALLTGNSVAGGVFTLVVIWLPAFISSFIMSVSNKYLFGYFDFSYYLYDEHWLSKYVYLDFDSLLTPKVLIYIGLIIVCSLLSFVVYKKRHLENHGEIIAFNSLGGLFKVLFGICFGILGYFWCAGMWNYESIATMFVFVPIGVIIANMLSNKGFTFKKLSRPMIVSLAIVAALLAIFRFDILGYETKIPKLSDIESITYVDGYQRFNYLENEEGVYEDVVLPKPVIKDREKIKEITDFHKKLIDKRHDNQFNFVNTAIIEYNLKDGTRLVRQYSLMDSDSREYERIMFETDAARKWRYPVFDTDNNYNYTKANICSKYSYQLGVFYDKDIDRIIEAIKKDKENITYSEYRDVLNNRQFEIDIYYQKEYIIDGKKYYEQNSDEYLIGEHDINTIALIKELGLTDVYYFDEFEIEACAYSVAGVEYSFDKVNDALNIDDYPFNEFIYNHKTSTYLYRTYLENDNEDAMAADADWVALRFIAKDDIGETFGIVDRADNMTKVVVFEFDKLPSELSYFVGLGDFDFSRYYELTYDVTHDELCDIGAITYLGA